MLSFLGSDAAAHISEEVRDAGLVIPRAMVISFFVNGFLGVIALVTFLFCIPSVYDALNDSTGYPILYVLRSSMSNETVTGLMAILLILMTASNIDFAASASRQIFALARDKGLPSSTWIAHVSDENFHKFVFSSLHIER
jgi:amino acid transporter